MASLKTLEKLQNRLPGAAAKPEQVQESGRISALQTAVSEAPQQPGIASKIGMSLASQAGKEQLQNLTASINEEQIQTQTQINRRSRETAERLETKRQTLNRLAEKNKQKIYQLDTNVANEIIDKRNQFQVDSAGRRYLNERQLADYTIMNAKNEQQLKTFAQQLEQSSNRKLQVMETVYKRITQIAAQAAQTSEQQLDQESKTKIVKIKQEYERRLEEERKAQAKRSGLANVVMSAAGGAMAVWPYGTVIGGAVVAAETMLPKGSKPSDLLGGLT